MGKVKRKARGPALSQAASGGALHHRLLLCGGSARLVIEIDGQLHLEDDVAIRDARRTAYLENQGLIVYRVTGADVMYDPDEAASEIIRMGKALSIA